MERLSKDYLCATLALGYLLLPLVGGLGTGLVYVYLVAVVFVQACIVFLAGAELVRRGSPWTGAPCRSPAPGRPRPGRCRRPRGPRP